MSSSSRGSRPRHRTALLAAAIAALGGWSDRVHAQQPPDTAAVADTTDRTGLLIRVSEEAQIRVPAMPTVGTEQVLPVGARIVLNRDTLAFLHARTVGDVIAGLDGVWSWRGGWLGRPELPDYQGRGATSVEYVVDGVPWVALGQDSLAADPSMFPTGFIDRIEVERLPGQLRVHLMTREHDRRAPFSMIHVSRGEFGHGFYEGMLQQRGESGFGFTLAANFRQAPAYYTNGGDFERASGWAELSHVPSARLGLRLRWRLDAPDRDAAVIRGTTADTASLQLKGTRMEWEGRVSLRNSEDGLGAHHEFFIQAAKWSSDSVDQSRYQAGYVAAHRTAFRSLGGSLWVGSRWTLIDARVNGGWTPNDRVTAGMEAAGRLHDAGRLDGWVMGRLGLSLPLGGHVTGTLRVGQQVARPSVEDDQAQTMLDAEVEAGFDRTAIGATVRYARLAAWRPVAYRQYMPTVTAIASAGETQWITANARLRPRQWFTVQGSYDTPVSGDVGGRPPTHSQVTAAIRSQFLRTFPSGFFDLKISATMENWGTGTLGLDADGEPVTLKGGTFVRGLIQMRFGDFVVYYDRYNLINADVAYVPGLPMPAQGSVYGVRWGFLN